MNLAWQWLRTHRLATAGVVALLCLAALGLLYDQTRQPGTPGTGQPPPTASVSAATPATFANVTAGAPAGAQKSAEYVGSTDCAQCHAAQHKEWTGSDHDLALQQATPATVLAPFKGERFTDGAVTSIFTQREGHFYVRTDGPDGRLHAFEITHTLGVRPLQQYLIPMPNQGMQALTIAWDTRAKAQGGQRWFHLQAGQHIRAGDPLHWTGRQNNWNFMCAECHTTQFKKNFDAQTGHYNSTWSAINVGCEACHGPGSAHAAWASKPDADRSADSHKGLLQELSDRRQVHWAIQSDTGNALRSQSPGTMRHEVEMCARCHAHRSQISDAYVHGKSLLDTHVPSLLDKDLFWADGQMKGEVYNYASFQQSKMYQKGVTCSDCHNPHTLKLRAPGNQTCLQCHAATKYDAGTHHFHQAGSTGTQCSACHMPTTTYMTVDPRHDHSIRVPRPDLSVRDGTPNACTKCHPDKNPQWAAKQAQQWYPKLQLRQTPLDQALHADDSGDPQAPNLLSQIVNDTAQSSVARATALSRMAANLDTTQLMRISAQLHVDDALMRKAAVDALASAPLENRIAWLRPLLSDPVRAVRMAAARWLAVAPTTDWSPADQAALHSALGEYIAAQRFNADRPESYNNLGMLYADQQQWPQAEATLKHAMKMEPSLAATWLNLADVYRAQGQEAQAQSLIRQLLQQQPRDAAAHHALGLSLLRQQRYTDAIKPLKEALRLEPGNSDYAYAYALLLDKMGQRPQAIATLQASLQSHPGGAQTAAALRAFCGGQPNVACKR